MCKDCGCEEGNRRAFFDKAARTTHAHAHPPDHAHPHDHSHDPGHPHDHDHDETGTRLIALEQKVLARNDEIAARNRRLLDERGVIAVNLISSPGTGKTLLLERTLVRLAGRVKCAVIAGDQRTDNDARRLAGKGAPVVQIETMASCHLDAERVEKVLSAVLAPGVKLLFIENVGNLVCPAAFDLGEHFKIVLLSVTEGEDKPQKYPVAFSSAPVAVITKTDLAPHVDWDRDACRRAIRSVRPDAQIFELSAKTGDGMDAWIGYLGGLAG